MAGHPTTSAATDRVCEPKPFLRWAGSKRSLLPKLGRFFDCYSQRRYIEPFVGSASLYFYLRPTDAVLGDANSALIQTYRTVRARPDAVAEALTAMKTGEDHYYRIRALEPMALDAVDRAARFIYLNRFCFNGLYRTNRDGRFNVPYGRPKTVSVPSSACLTDCARQLRSATLVSGDFENVVRSELTDNTCGYLDPPFYKQKGRVFREYTSKPFAEDDLKPLQNLLVDIDRAKAVFVLSYVSCTEALECFSHWNSFRVRTHRSISGAPRFRRKYEELIVTNMPARINSIPDRGAH